MLDGATKLKVHKLLRGSHARMWTIRLRLHGKALNSKVWKKGMGDRTQPSLLGGSSQDLDTWLITMVIVSPPSRVVGPLPTTYDHHGY